MRAQIGCMVPSETTSLFWCSKEPCCSYMVTRFQSHLPTQDCWVFSEAMTRAGLCLHFCTLSMQKVNEIALNYIVVVTRLKKLLNRWLRNGPDDCMYLLGLILKVCCWYWMAYGSATLDDFPGEKSSTASQLCHFGVIFSSLRTAETRTNWGSGLE